MTERKKTDYDTRARELVACDACGAAAGTPCRGSLGPWKRTTHWIRRRDASKVAKLKRESNALVR